MGLGRLKVDFMPDDCTILGFSNRWYPQGIKTALTYPLSDTLMIKHLRPEVFIATELDAFLGRGENDLLMSRDVEDILLLVDGRPELVSEIQQAEHDVKSFIVEQFEVLQQHDGFEEFVAGNIRGPEGRVDVVLERFAVISAIAGNN